MIAALAATGVLAAAYFAGTGFIKRTDVVLVDYSVSEDGTAIRLEVGVASSMGYTRGCTDTGGGVEPHYLTFYNTFGGLNSSLGAVHSVVLEPAPRDTEIYFNRADRGYELVLRKNAGTGAWERPGK